MAAAHRGRAWLLIGVPLAAGVRGALLSVLRRQPRWLAYFGCFVAYNYVGIIRALFEARRDRTAASPPPR